MKADKWKTVGLCLSAIVFALGLCLIVGSLAAAIAVAVAKNIGG